jgi:uncharacterized protein with PQ loop repeat
MDWIGLLGAIGTVLGLIRAVPQLVRLWRAQRADGVSPDSSATSAAVSSGWAVYGALTGQLYVVLATGASALIFAAVTLLAIRYGRTWRELRVAPIWSIVLVGAGVIAGAAGLGVILPISVLAANLPQIRVAWRETDLRGVSLGSWLLSLSDGLIWGGYALAAQDAAILTYGIFGLATSAVIIGLKLRQGRAGVDG